jgi:hypothetical protein
VVLFRLNGSLRAFSQGYQGFALRLPEAGEPEKV